MLTSQCSYDRMLMERYADLHEGDSIRYIPAASYLNELITNGRVFVPAYWHEGLPMSVEAKPERVQVVMGGSFPGRTIVPIDP